MIIRIKVNLMITFKSFKNVKMMRGIKLIIYRIFKTKISRGIKMKIFRGIKIKIFRILKMKINRGIKMKIYRGIKMKIFKIINKKTFSKIRINKMKVLLEIRANKRDSKI